MSAKQLPRITSLLIGTLFVWTFYQIASLGLWKHSTYPWDFFIGIENSWWIQTGLRPYCDFPSPIGWTYSAVIWLGGLFSNATIDGLFYGPIILGLALSAAAAGLTRRKTLLARALSIITPFLMCTIPRVIGNFDFQLLSYASFYNKFGWALIFVWLLAFIYLLENEKPERWVNVLFGLLFSTLFFLKISFTGFAIFSLIGFLLILVIAKKKIQRPLVATLVSLGLFIVLTKFSLACMFSEYWTLNKLVPSTALSDGIKYLASNNQTTLSFLGATLLLQTTISFCLKGSKLRLLTAFAIVISLGLLLLAAQAATAEAGELIPLALLPYVFSSAIAETLEPKRWLFVVRFIGFLALPILLFRILETDFKAIDFAKKSDRGFHLSDSPELKSFPFATTEEKRNQFLRTPMDASAPREGAFFSLYLEYGVRALKEAGETGGQVFVFDWLNPFDGILKLPPAAHMPSFSHFGRAISESQLPDSSTFLQSVRIIMVPKVPLQIGHVNFYQRQYGTLVKERYYKAYENLFWTIFRRKQI